MPVRSSCTVPPAAGGGRTRRSTTSAGGSDAAAGAAVASPAEEAATALASGRASRHPRIHVTDGGRSVGGDGGGGGGGGGLDVGGDGGAGLRPGEVRRGSASSAAAVDADAPRTSWCHPEYQHQQLQELELQHRGDQRHEEMLQEMHREQAMREPLMQQRAAQRISAHHQQEQQQRRFAQAQHHQRFPEYLKYGESRGPEEPADPKVLMRPARRERLCSARGHASHGHGLRTGRGVNRGGGASEGSGSGGEGERAAAIGDIRDDRSTRAESGSVRDAFGQESRRTRQDLSGFEDLASSAEKSANGDGAAGGGGLVSVVAGDIVRFETQAKIRERRKREAAARSRELRRVQELEALIVAPEEAVVDAVRLVTRVVRSKEVPTAPPPPSLTSRARSAQCGVEGAGLPNGRHRGSSRNESLTDRQVHGRSPGASARRRRDSRQEAGGGNRSGSGGASISRAKEVREDARTAGLRAERVSEIGWLYIGVGHLYVGQGVCCACFIAKTFCDVSRKVRDMFCTAGAYCTLRPLTPRHLPVPLPLVPLSRPLFPLPLLLLPLPLSAYSSAPLSLLSLPSLSPLLLSPPSP